MEDDEVNYGLPSRVPSPSLLRNCNLPEAAFSCGINPLIIPANRKMTKDEEIVVILDSDSDDEPVVVKEELKIEAFTDDENDLKIVEETLARPKQAPKQPGSKSSSDKNTAGFRHNAHNNKGSTSFFGPGNKEARRAIRKESRRSRIRERNKALTETAAAGAFSLSSDRSEDTNKGDSTAGTNNLEERHQRNETTETTNPPNDIPSSVTVPTAEHLTTLGSTTSNGHPTISITINTPVTGNELVSMTVAIGDSLPVNLTIDKNSTTMPPPAAPPRKFSEFCQTGPSIVDGEEVQRISSNITIARKVTESCQTGPSIFNGEEVHRTFSDVSTVPHLSSIHSSASAQDKNSQSRPMSNLLAGTHSAHNRYNISELLERSRNHRRDERSRSRSSRGRERFREKNSSGHKRNRSREKSSSEHGTERTKENSASGQRKERSRERSTSAESRERRPQRHSSGHRKESNHSKRKHRRRSASSSCPEPSGPLFNTPLQLSEIIKSCTQCLSLFNSRNEAIIHQKEKHDAKHCPVCFVLLSRKGNTFKNHLTKFHAIAKDQEKVDCRFCSKTFNFEGIYNHIARMHLKPAEEDALLYRADNLPPILLPQVSRVVTTHTTTPNSLEDSARQVHVTSQSPPSMQYARVIGSKQILSASHSQEASQAHSSINKSRIQPNENTSRHERQRSDHTRFQIPKIVSTRSLISETETNAIGNFANVQNNSRSHIPTASAVINSRNLQNNLRFAVPIRGSSTHEGFSSTQTQLYRSSLTAHDIGHLQLCYLQNATPTQAELEGISKKILVDVDIIKNWFITTHKSQCRNKHRR